MRQQATETAITQLRAAPRANGHSAELSIVAQMKSKQRRMMLCRADSQHSTVYKNEALAT